MNIPRKILKQIVRILSRRAIEKHDMELIVVTGFYGTEIVREGIYELLSETYNVRRNTAPIKWDMAIPLAVLGYEDKRRNTLQWLGVVIKASLFLLLGRKNPHKLILNANCTFEATAKFWSTFLEPDYLVILNYDQDSKIVDALLDKLNPDKSILIYDKDKVDQKRVKGAKSKTVFVYGKEDAPLTYDTKSRKISYKDEVLQIPKIVPKVTIPHVTAVFAVAIQQGIQLSEAGFSALKFDMGAFLVQRIKTNFEKAGTD